MNVACEPADYTQHRGMELDVSNKSKNFFYSQKTTSHSFPLPFSHQIV